MGTDISGWVETRKAGSNWWDAAIHIDDIVYRQYGMFASLFGMRNGAPGAEVFRAIAPNRGVPPGASEYFSADFNGFGVGETWVLWSELAAIDWDEEGEEEYIDEEPLHIVYAEPGPGRRPARRGDFLNGGWATLFQMMALLAEQFGADNVRLSVWFDQ
ncbi:MAG TPA: hypothetical protein VJQ45_12745 [Ktedonobacterales bacterium]|nr:hypothetical protein [Ktedonobacterales bacterium]